MALREVAPFNDKQWELLMKNMKRGQTPEQAARIKKAREEGKHYKCVNFSIPHMEDEE